MHTSIGHQCCDQLTAVKTWYPLIRITWLYRGLRFWPIKVKYFLKLSADKLQVFKWSQAQVWFFFKFKWNMFCFCAAQLKSWFKTDLGRENSANYYRQRRQLLLTLLTMVTHWSRSTSNFYALVGQNLSGELMRKIYAASWILFTLRAEADRVLCQLVMFLTAFFNRMYKMKYSFYQESSVIHGWFVYWVFGWEMQHLETCLLWQLKLTEFFVNLWCF